MKQPGYIYLILLLFFSCMEIQSQHILLVEKPGKFKNFKYFTGDKIIIRTLSDGTKIEGPISEITDTSLLINYDQEVMLDDIERVIRPLWGTRILSGATRIAGAGYFALDVVNNAINNEVVIDQQTVMISAGLVAFSYALVPFHYRKLKIGDRWRIKSLNMSMDAPVTNPFLQ